MTLPIDSRTPLLLVSDLVDRLNWKNAADNSHRLLNGLVRNSSIFQAVCRRRFDEYIETRYYTPFALQNGGDLFGLRNLRLDADLKTYTAITNGDASPISAGNVTLLPLNSAYKDEVRLNPYGVQFWYHAGVTDPRGSISVAGTWGYGGRWVDTGATISTGINASATSLVSSAPLEAGMVLRAESEYLYVSATVSTTNTIERAFNGSTAASHLAAVPLYRWVPLPTVQEAMTRMYEVALERDKAPLFGQMIIGDVVFPTTVDAWPKDVIDTIRLAGLVRTPRVTCV